MKFRYRIAYLAGSSAMALFAAQAALAMDFNVPSGDLRAALDSYKLQSGVSLFVLTDSVKGVHTSGVKGELPADEALSRILRGTGFVVHRDPSGVIAVVREQSSEQINSITPLQLAQAAPPPRASVETVTVTSSKLGGADVQSIPIAITALSQEQLTATQTAGGPDLVKQVPNLTFSKTNFTGYNIQIRGIGTQAISVTTDPAVAVALNDIPFIRNHFFEQEFFDLSQAEVLRGPQGTLYGRNATAGVVNIITAKPTDQFEAQASADIGNYHNRRFEGMINIPVVDDRVDIRVAGEWTKRDGYSFNELTDKSIDGRDLWSGRVTIGWKPTANIQTYLVWEHFSEDDDRMRTSKQLCKTDPIRTEIGGTPVSLNFGGAFDAGDYLNQGCLPTSLYSANAFGVPNGYSLPYYAPLTGLNVPFRVNFDPYASTTQSTNLRDIESTLDPVYKAKSDTVEFNADYTISPALTFTSQTGFNNDFLWSTEDYNRFNTQPGAFDYIPGSLPAQTGVVLPDPNGLGLCLGYGGLLAPGGCDNGLPAGAVCTPNVGIGGCTGEGVFCDPQLGCSDRLVAEDLSEEHAWQLSQEFRISSKFSGPFNFSLGANYLHYETEENYYVFINSLTLASAFIAINNHRSTPPYVSGVSDNRQCLRDVQGGLVYQNPQNPPNNLLACIYIDPNPIGSLNNQGHNYFLSQNPYVLNSYAGFGEAYYNVTTDLKLTGGLRWTDDRKHFVDIPSELIADGYGYASTGVVDQGWNQWTGRFAANWSPKLDFTDQTLVYGSFAHGYKAGGANPPGAVLYGVGGTAGTPVHPLTFKPEFIDAYELGTKNTLLDGALTLNGDVFYYNYKGYQISEIVDRTAINLNFDATVRGAELETSWEPTPGLKFRFTGGYEATRIADGSQAVDLMDRTAGDPNWVVLKPFPTQASNCIIPSYVAIYMATTQTQNTMSDVCNIAYNQGHDPETQAPYTPNPANNSYGEPIPPGAYPGFDPSTAPNQGEGISKNLGGNELPNAPRFTVSLSADYTIPVSQDWAATLHSDYYWQDYSWARVFNDNPYDRLRGYTNVNLALILTNQNGWQVMGYVKNIFDTTDITGAFLNSDDSGLTTNVFLTDPRLFGVRVTKNW